MFRGSLQSWRVTCFTLANVQLATRYMLTEMHAGLHVKCWFFLNDFDQNYSRTKVFPNLFLNTKFYTCGQRSRYSDWLRAGRSEVLIPVGGEIFRTCPDQPWGPPSLLYNGYRVFPGGRERPGRDADPSPPSSAVVMKEQSYTSAPAIGRTTCTEPQCLYKGVLHLTFFKFCTYIFKIFGSLYEERRTESPK